MNNMAPTIYLEPYWEEVVQGRLLSSVLEEIAQIQQGENSRGPFDLFMMKDYEKVKPKLFIRMCDPEKNTEYLKDKPYTVCGELVAFYRIEVLQEGEMNGSIAITDDILCSWGITKGQLHQDAVQTEKERNPACLYRMDDILFSAQSPNLLKEDAPLQIGDMPIFVLINRDKMDGAGTMVQDGVLEKVGELLGTDYYMAEQAKEMTDRVFSSGSYHEALNIIGEYVNITSVDEPERRPSVRQQMKEAEPVKPSGKQKPAKQQER